MNKIYKVIYCKQTQTWVAVSECAKSGGKGKRATVAKPAHLPLQRLALALLIGLGGFGQQAMAQQVCSTTNAGAGTGTAGYAGAFACGIGANAEDRNTIAIGNGSKASAGHSTNRRRGDGAIALGINTKAENKGATAIGSEVWNPNMSKKLRDAAQASNQFSTAVGTGTTASGKLSTAIGEDTQALKIQSVAVGSRARAVGQQTTALGNDSMAIGDGSVVIGGDDSTQLVGGVKKEKFFLDANGEKYYYGRENGGIIGTAELGGVKVYRNALAGGLGSTSINVHAQTLSEGSVAIGIGSLAGQFDKTAFILANAGDPTKVDANGNIVVKGLTPEDFKDFGYNDRATAIGAAARATGEQSAAIGVLARSEGEDSSAFGSNTHSVGKRSTAIGYDTTTYTRGSVAIGEGAIAGHATDANKKDAIAIGTGSQATGNQSIAIGYGNIVTGSHSGAIGDPNTISGSGSYALGNNNTIAADNSFVVGNNVNVGAAHTGAVVLGHNSTIEAAHTGDYTLGGERDGQVAGRRGAGTQVVSVGSRGNERQIQHVAPGVVSPNSTDAINGSQLYHISQQLDRTASAGIASSIAIASLAQSFDPGGSTLGVGVGTFRGQTALSIGGSVVSDNGKWILKGSVSANTQSDIGAGGSINFHW